jgi:hypothetical protein
MENALTIFDVAVRRDKDGRYCLNDLHRASGGESRHQPANWLRSQQTQELIEEVSKLNPHIRGIQLKQGVGTFVAKELVYAYATWVSAAFHLQVIRAYDALVTGALDEAIRIARRQQDRQAARLEAPALTDAIKHSREVVGKEVAHYHFVNEFDLINRVALGMSAKQYRAAHGLSADGSIRDTLTALEIKCIGHLQRYNASLIDFGLPFEKRKTELHKLYCLQYAGALACEVQRLEA